MKEITQNEYIILSRKKEQGVYLYHITKREEERIRIFEIRNEKKTIIAECRQEFREMSKGGRPEKVSFWKEEE